MVFKKHFSISWTYRNTVGVKAKEDVIFLFMLFCLVLSDITTGLQKYKDHKLQKHVLIMLIIYILEDKILTST